MLSHILSFMRALKTKGKREGQKIPVLALFCLLNALEEGKGHNSSGNGLQRHHCGANVSLNCVHHFALSSSSA